MDAWKRTYRGVANEASDILCSDKDGNQSNIQETINKLRSSIDVRYNPKTNNVEIYSNGKWNKYQSVSIS